VAFRINRRFLLVLLLAGSGAFAGDWPEWRGPARNGTTPEVVRSAWGDQGPRVAWRASVGTGFSSVSIANGRAYTLGNTNNEDTIWCFDARRGKVLWKIAYPARLDPQWYEGGPGSTPTVHDGRVYTISKWGDVFCLDAVKGRVIWKEDLRARGFKPNRWGFAGSALICRGLVIFNAGAAGAALDSQTGKMVWCNGTNGAAYASPTLFKSGDSESILIFAAKHLVAVDPASGRELWRQFFETGWDTNITDPLFCGGNILISSFSHGCALLKLTTGQPEVIYDSKALHNHLSPGILLGEYLYAFNGEAKQDTDFRCLHVPTGQVKWTSKDPKFGSLIYAAGKLVILSDKGELLIVDPSPDSFAPVARAKVLSGTCWIPPALANGFLYVRNAKGELRCLDLKP
jgi:outer membrane protein assembly factor BamB